MPLDPEFDALLARLAEAGALPLIRGSAADTRAHYLSLAMARRGAGYQPEPVAAVRDELLDGPGGTLPVRVYTPDADRGRVVTYLHGGGWVVGNVDTHDPVCRRVANALGAVVVSVDYRLAPEHPYPAALDDTLAAMAWVAASYPDRPHTVAGDSAGASLAAGASVRNRDAGGPRLAAQLLIYPATDPSMSQRSIADNSEGYFLTRADMRWFYDQYLPQRTGPNDPVVDLLHLDELAGLPPAVVATAEYDPLRDEGEAYAQRLSGAGVRTRLVTGPGLVHGYFAFVGAVAAADRRSAEVLAALDQLLTTL